MFSLATRVYNNAFHPLNRREKLKTKKDRSGQNSSKEKGKKRKRKDKKEDRQEKKKLKRNDKVPREEGGKSSKEESNQRGSDESSQFEEGELLVLSETGEKEDPIESETKTAEFGFIRVFNPVKETTSSSSGLPTIGVRHLLRMGKDDRSVTQQC